MSSTQSGSRSTASALPIEEFERLAQKVDQAIAEVQAMPADMRAKAMSLKSAIEEFHKVGLTQIVRTLKSDPRGKELLYELVDQPEIYALFSMHGLVRADLRTQVSRVIEMVRPYLQSHGGDVSLVDIREQVVMVRLSGNCTGCSMSQVTLKNTVEETLKQHIPEIERVQVVDHAPTEVVQIQLNNSAEAGWMSGPLVDEIPTDRPYSFACGDVSVLIVRSVNGLRAYRNSCAHQGLPLDGGMLNTHDGTITCPWHGFSFDTESGECFTAPQCQLEAFPLRINNNRIWVRPE